MGEANVNFRNGHFETARKLYEQGLLLSKRRKDRVNEACFLAGLGTAHVIRHEYQLALFAFAEAARAARESGYHELVLRVAVNHASLYRRMGERKEALRIMHEVNDLLPAQPPAWLMVQLGNIVSDANGPAAAEPFFRYAADVAAGAADTAAEATAWSQMGYGYLRNGNLAKAEPALTEAYRLRLLHKDARIGTSYYYLGVLRIEQGKPQEALLLLDQTHTARTPDMAIAPAFVLFQRARALAALGRTGESLGEYEKALHAARDWRLRVLVPDSFRVSADVTLQEIYDSYIRTGMESFTRSGDTAIAARMFEVAEINRAASLRERLEFNQRTPAEALQHHETTKSQASGPSPSTGGTVTRERGADSQTGTHLSPSSNGRSKISHQNFEKSAPEVSLGSLQRILSRNDALLSFQTSSDVSYVWVITRTEFRVFRLPAREQLMRTLTHYRDGLQSGADVRASGAAAFGDLLKPAWSKLKDKTSLIISLDEALHGFPFAALPVSADGKRYLIERFALRYVPGAAMLTGSEPDAQSRRFAGFFDPIYNAADPRWKGGEPDPDVELARLPGTQREIETSVSAWGAPRPALLSGAQLRSDRLQQILRDGAAVAHFATHVVPDPATNDSVRIALGLGADGRGEFLTPGRLVQWRAPIGLVVLSGCGSGTGRPLPGAGLVGFARAWLLAGSRSVLATYWPITDEQERFFADFYKALHENSGRGVSCSRAAAALQIAQIAAIRRGDSQSRPAHWAAFFVVGKD